MPVKLLKVMGICVKIITSIIDWGDYFVTVFRESGKTFSRGKELFTGSVCGICA
ncbi:MAG: hypothetical protein ACI4KI_04285 [Candidatus Fimenecus sp.]